MFVPQSNKPVCAGSTGLISRTDHRETCDGSVAEITDQQNNPEPDTSTGEAKAGH